MVLPNDDLAPPEGLRLHKYSVGLSKNDREIIEAFKYVNLEHVNMGVKDRTFARSL